MRRRAFTSLLAALVLAATSAAPAQDFTRARALIHRQLTEQKVPSIAVAAARDGKFLWEEGFGWADRENRVAATEHTMYSLASISKPITATGLMLLVDLERVDLDKPIDDYLGTAKITARVGRAADATVRRVANHTSGLGLHYQFFYEDEPYRRPSMDETILRYAHLFFEPGVRYQYSNLGYGLLDYVIERVSGRPYPDFMREEIFLPLGLTRMSVGIGPRLEEHAAVRYNREGTPLPFYDFDHRGGSAVFASAHDLARFGMFHVKQRLADQATLLSDAAIEEMQKPGMNDYGLGWGVNKDWNGYRVMSHGGGMPGVATALWIVPSEKVVVVVLSNTSGVAVHGIASEILGAILRVETSSRGNSQGGSEPGFDPPAALTGEWSGAIHTYEGERTLVLRIEKSGTVRVRLGTQLWTLLNQVRFEDGILQGRFAGDVETRDASKKPHIIMLTLKQRGNVLNGSAATVSIPTPRGSNAQSHWVELKK